MALNFTRSAGDECNFGSGTSIDGFSTFTFWAWIRPTSFASDSFIWTKGLGAKELKTEASAIISGSVTRATTTASFETTTTLTLDVWNFIVFTYSESNGPKCFLGSLTAAATECSYSSAPTVGAGATVDDSANDFMCPDDVGFSEGLDGDIAEVGYHNAEFSLGQIRAIQFKRKPVSSLKLHAIYGWDGTSNVPEYSGNGNNGTPTGATVVAHVPLLNPFASQSSLLYAISTPKIVTINQVTETDTAQSITWAPKIRILGSVTETDTAQSITKALIALINQVTETNLAQSISWSPKNRLIAQVVESNIAFSITWSPKNRLVNLVTETNTAQTITPLTGLSALINQVLESNTAQSINWSPKIRIISQVLETDIAQAINSIGGLPVGNTDISSRRRRRRE